MQFINIVVHSVENMNFRVHLQYEFTRHGLDEYLEVGSCAGKNRLPLKNFRTCDICSVYVKMLKFTESDRLLVQIQAYLDNVFDVGALLEDAETKNALLEHLEELQELNAQVITRRAHTQSSSTVRQITSCVCVSQLSSRLQESERDAMEKVSQLEKNLLQTTKEVELLKVKSAVLWGRLFCPFLKKFSFKRGILKTGSRATNHSSSRIK